MRCAPTTRSWPNYGQRSGSFWSPTEKSSAGSPPSTRWLARWDADFSARLGDAGFVGLTIPTEYGGRGLGHLHRYVVTEELLAHGAPVAAHWFADRQFAPVVVVVRHRRAAPTSFCPVIADGPAARGDRDE